MCTNPLVLYDTGKLTEKGKIKYTFDSRQVRGSDYKLVTGSYVRDFGHDNAYLHDGHYIEDKQRLNIFDYVRKGIYVPCGRCLECRLSHAREFALRSTHEVQYHPNNIFFTLTYDNKHLQSNSLIYKDLQDFWKRLRSDISEHPADYIQSKDTHISYISCGEYGSINRRPHFHAIVYNLDFADRRSFYYEKRGDYMIYRSATLERLWTNGFSTLGMVNFAVSQYVAGYIMKKQCGKDLRSMYGDRLPEKVFISQKPAIGFSWLQDNYVTMLNKGYCMAKSRKGMFKMHIPRYYLKKCEELYPIEYSKYLERRPEQFTTVSNAFEHVNGRDTKLDGNEHRMVYMETINDDIERDMADSYYTLSDNFEKSLDVEEF